jgi:hypothetical protein
MTDKFYKKYFKDMIIFFSIVELIIYQIIKLMKEYKKFYTEL